jgi:hypothetical protein
MGRSLLSIGLCWIIVGCGGAVECNALPCPTGVRVVLTSPPSGAYRVEVTAPGDTTVHAQDCSGNDRCEIFFPINPTQVQIKVIAASGTTTYDKPVGRATTYPNGADCGSCEATLPVMVP